MYFLLQNFNAEAGYALRCLSIRILNLQLSFDVVSVDIDLGLLDLQLELNLLLGMMMGLHRESDGRYEHFMIHAVLQVEVVP